MRYNKVNIALVIAGLAIILFAAFCPSIIAETHSAAWRIVIGLLGCFSFVSGVIFIRQKKPAKIEF